MSEALTVANKVEKLEGEPLKIYKWRYEVATELGMIDEEAMEFALSSVDLDELRKLADANCPPEFLWGILK